MPFPGLTSQHFDPDLLQPTRSAALSASCLIGQSCARSSPSPPRHWLPTAGPQSLPAASRRLPALFMSGLPSLLRCRAGSRAHSDVSALLPKAISTPYRLAIENVLSHFGVRYFLTWCRPAYDPCLQSPSTLEGALNFFILCVRRAQPSASVCGHTWARQSSLYYSCEPTNVRYLHLKIVVSLVSCRINKGRYQAIIVVTFMFLRICRI